MKIIISPAKKMNVDTDSLDIEGMPADLERSKKILLTLKGMDYQQLKKLWKCNDKIATEQYDRLKNIDLEKGLTPAILSYEGIQYKYMSPGIFEYEMFDYINQHLRILSGLYGVLSPMHGVCPYRLEMQSKLEVGGCKNLYEFWGDSLYNSLGDPVILNLASLEYGRCIEKYLQPSDIYITCVFGELSNEKVVTKATFAKMARGAMVRFMAERKIDDLEKIKDFAELGFAFDSNRSSDSEYVFLR